MWPQSHFIQINTMFGLFRLFKVFEDIVGSFQSESRHHKLCTHNFRFQMSSWKMVNYQHVFGCTRKLVKRCHYQHFIYPAKNAPNKLECCWDSGWAWVNITASIPHVFIILPDFWQVIKLFLSLTDLNSQKHVKSPLYGQKYLAIPVDHCI